MRYVENSTELVNSRRRKGRGISAVSGGNRTHILNATFSVDEENLTLEASH
jgi:hypothetical protein